MPDPYRKGGPHDDVARSIRNEQMRDAAPHPDEAREQHRQMLADEGCLVCGEDDPDELSIVHPHIPPCDAYPIPLMSRDVRVFCDEHRRPSTALWWAGMVKRARDHDAEAVVVYMCDSVEFATMPDMPEREKGPQIDGWDDVPPAHRPIPKVPIRCRCGAALVDVRPLGDVE